MENLLILDIDETLVHSNESLVDNLPCDYFVLDYIGYKRPYLDVFLKWAFSNFKIGFWLAGGQYYVNEILNNILSKDQIPEFIYHSDHCTREFKIDPFDGEYPQEIITKKLAKLKKKFNLAKTLVLDDYAEAHKHNYGNLVFIKKFKPGNKDCELLKVRPFIEAWFKEDDVRKIEKRGWSNATN